MLRAFSNRRPNGSPLLLAGFDPFGGAGENPSQRVVEALAGETVSGHPVVCAVLPTAFGAASTQLLACIARERPALVLCLGQAGGRAAVSIERVAINVADARIPDNTGAQPVDEAVVPGGPAAYFSGLPVKAMFAALRQAGIAVEVSNSAGTFVCNHVFYTLMHTLETRRDLRGGDDEMRGGFVHLPWLPGQGLPAMPQEEMLRAVRLLLETALARREDVCVGAGRLD
ncbi:MAG: pyroglutamyl-peptidase I [Pseudomonadota bacterium]